MDGCDADLRFWPDSGGVDLTKIVRFFSMECKSGSVSVTFLLRNSRREVHSRGGRGISPHQASLEKRREASPMNGIPVDQDDKLAVSMSGLEQRWNDMARTIREQRDQIVAMNGQAEAQKEAIEDLESQVLMLQERTDALEAEKVRVIARIEGLLGRYEE